MGLEEFAARLALDDESLIDPASPVIVLEDRPTGPVPGLTAFPAVIVGVDVLAADPAEVELIATQIARAPVASVALALLLRGRGGRTVEESLVAESTTYSMLQAGPEFAAWRATRAKRATSAADGPAVVCERDGDTLHVTLNRPQRHNAYSSAVRDGLVDALRLAAADPDLRVVLDANGPSFSSGGDLAEFGTFTDPASAHVVRQVRSAARLLVRLGHRVEAHVHGACLGAGVELPSFCHRVIARADSVFGLPELGLGLIPGAGGTASMPPRIGTERTMWLALTGTRIGAATALQWGLVDEIGA